TTNLAGAGEAVRAREIAGARRLDAQPGREAARDGGDPVALPRQQPQVQQPPERRPGAREKRRAWELTGQMRRHGEDAREPPSPAAHPRPITRLRALAEGEIVQPFRDFPPIA